MSEKRYKDGAPCDHPGCTSHRSHPCEGCGRIGAREVSEKTLYEQALDAVRAIFEQEETAGAIVDDLEALKNEIDLLIEATKFGAGFE